MKRIIAMLLLIFISSLLLNNFFASYKKNYTNSLKINLKLSKEDTLKLDTINISKIDSSFNNVKVKKHLNINKATWYHTRGTRVHREHPTAATHRSIPKGTWLLIKNYNTNDSCIVEVTDRHGMGSDHIDLSHKAFGILSRHSAGKIKVIVKELH